MTRAQRLALVSNGGTGDVRLGIPPIRAVDGPNGIGDGTTHVTAFPAAETIAASWDPALARAYGQALGAEAAGKGFDVLYAPTVNIVRTPLWGREPETLGEDPFLTGSLDAPEIRGIQSQHVIAQVKHYVAYNQEVGRYGQPLATDAISAQVSKRALEEIYMPAFRAAVTQGHVGSVMCSYNRINMVYSCQNPQTLNILKSFGLQGYVGPDESLAVRDDVAAINAGVDNMQLGSISTAAGGSELSILTKAYQSGQLSPARLDEATRRILTAMFAMGLVDHQLNNPKTQQVSTPAHVQLATRVAEQGTVLLRNRHGVLPLSPTVGTIAVIGHDAGPGTQIEENGSSVVRQDHVVTPLEGIRHLVGGRSRITYVPGTLGVVPLPTIPSDVLTPSSGTGHGLSASYFSGQSATGTPVLSRIDPNIDFASKSVPLAPIPDTPAANAGVWTGTLTPPATGTYRFSLEVAGNAQLSIGGHVIVTGNTQGIASPGGLPITFQGLAQLNKGQPMTIVVQYATDSSVSGAALQMGWEPPDPSMLVAAVNAARNAKVAIVFANDVTGEGMDRTSLQLPGDQDQLIQAVAAANPHTIVVLHTAGPVLMPWLSEVAGVLEAWYPGQQSGQAIAATLFGDSDPSGHLPVTFPAMPSQGPATQPSEYPGIDGVAQYSEGIFVGYRYYDHYDQEPMFPFGYGLSYTSFSLSHLAVTSRGEDAYQASVTLHNTGQRAGAEVVQVYVGDPATTGEPPRQLKGYAKVFLDPHSSRAVHVTLPRSSFAYFDQSQGQFVVVPGNYTISVGTSSRDLPLSAQIRIG